MRFTLFYRIRKFLLCTNFHTFNYSTLNWEVVIWQSSLEVARLTAAYFTIIAHYHDSCKVSSDAWQPPTMMFYPCSAEIMEFNGGVYNSTQNSFAVSSTKACVVPQVYQ